MNSAAFSTFKSSLEVSHPRIQVNAPLEERKRFMVVWKPERDIMTNKLISPSKADRQMERGRVCNLRPYILHREAAACLQGPAEFDRRAASSASASLWQPEVATEHPVPCRGHCSGSGHSHGVLWNKMSEVHRKKYLVLEPGWSWWRRERWGALCALHSSRLLQYRL